MARIGVVVLLLGLACNAFGQNLNKQMKRISEDQVPLSIKKAFASTFGEIPADGFWVSQITTFVQGERTVANPIWYAFRGKGTAKGIEVRFAPDGEVIFYKGIAPREGQKPKQDGNNT